jgi:hypothetical protein
VARDDDKQKTALGQKNFTLFISSNRHKDLEWTTITAKIESRYHHRPKHLVCDILKTYRLEIQLSDKLGTDSKVGQHVTIDAMDIERVAR